MASPEFPLDRRELMAGSGRGRARPALAAAARAQARPALALQAKAEQPCPAPGRPGNADLVAARARAALQARRDPRQSPSATNCRCRPCLNWRGIDGVPAAEPLTGRPPLAAGGKEALQLPLRHAGTFLCDLSLLGDGNARPSRARALIVQESEAVAVDRDEVLLIEDWRFRADGTAIAPGHRSRRKPCRSIRLTARLRSISQPGPTNACRLRFINGCQRTVIALETGERRGSR